MEKIQICERQQSRENAMIMLLTILPKKKEKWFHHLIFALQNGEHEDLAKEIIPTLAKYGEGLHFTDTCIVI